METNLLKKNISSADILKVDVNHIKGMYPLNELLGKLEAIMEKAKHNVHAVLLDTINGLPEGIRPQNSHWNLKNAAAHLPKFHAIKDGFINKSSHHITLLSWLNFMSTEFLADQYHSELERFNGNIDAETDADAKYAATSNFISDQLLNELKSNVCSKGEFLYHYIKAGLITEKEICYLLNIEARDKKIYTKEKNDKIPAGPRRDYAENMKEVIEQLDVIYSHKRKNEHFDSTFPSYIDAVLGDPAKYSVYDTFTWYLEKGHPDNLDLSLLQTDIEDPEEFMLKNDKLIKKIETTYNMAVMSNGKENALSKQDTARQDFSKAVEMLSDEVKAKCDVLLGIDLIYKDSKLEDLAFDVEIENRETGEKLIGDYTVDVKKQILMTVMKNAKTAVSIK